MDPGDFFNKNAHFYGVLKPHKYDYFFMDFISKNKKGCNLLDVGGGGGCFAKLCKENLETAEICIVDPSKALLEKQGLENIRTVIGKLPDELNVDEKFDYIHIKEVLHHVTGPSIEKSKDLFLLSLRTLKKNNLNQSGYILIHEIFYESYIIPTFTRSLLFNLLKLQNKLNLKIPFKEFIRGLDVCFYTRDELKSLFKETGFRVVDYYEEYWTHAPIKKKMLLLKNWGRMCFIIQSVDWVVSYDSDSIVNI